MSFLLFLICDSVVDLVVCVIFFFKQKTAYEMRISDWSSDVCSSDLSCLHPFAPMSGLTRLDERIICIIFRQPWPTSNASTTRGSPHDTQVPCHRRAARAGSFREIGRASCRERVCQYV